MASGAGWHPPYGTASGNPSVIPGTEKYNSSPPSNMFHEGGSTLEYTQDLHLKMSKKIAQLTKVIYALNTKNGEHEEELESLREAHEDEVRHVAVETRDQLARYQGRPADRAELRRRLRALEESAETQEHARRQALAEFEAYRRRAEDAQLCAEAQHTQRVVSMSREVEEMRRDFEEKLRAFGRAQAQAEQERRRAVDELRDSQRQEVQDLLHSRQNQSASSTVDQERLAELHRGEVEGLMERAEELTRDKLRLAEEYEGKLAKAQGFYERELEAMRRTQQLTAENLLTWKRTEVELRKEFQAQEAALQRTLGKLRAELQRAQEEARESRDTTNRLQTSLTNADGTIKNLHKQLEEAVQDGEIWVMQLKDTEYELEGSRNRVQQQATEILHKASQIGSLQATQMSHEATMRDLDSEQSRLREKIQSAEQEREALLNQSQNTDGKHREQVQDLEQSLREERQGYEKELGRLRAQYEEEAGRFREAQVQALDQMDQQHQEEQQEAQDAAERERSLLMEEMGQEYEIQRLSLEEQRDRLQQQLDNLKKELSAKLNIANQEVCHLQELVKEGELNLGTAHTQMSSLKETQDKLGIELDVTRARVRETSNLLTDLQEEIETQKQQHDARVMSIRTEEKQKMDKMAEDLDQKWTDALREELVLLREGLREESEADRQVALSQLSQQKDLEMMAAREGWHRKVEDLLEQISLLKQSLELQLSQSQAALQQLQAQFSLERERLAQQLRDLQHQHQSHQRRLQDAHCCALTAMEDARVQHIRALEERLKLEQREEVHALKEAHRRTLDVLRQQSDQELQTLRFELEDEGKAMLASLRSELNHLHATAVEHLRQTQLKDNTAAKLLLEGAVEHSQKQEQGLLGRISDLQQEVSCRTNRITDLDYEIHQLNESIGTLTRELEHKGKEVLRVRSEAGLQIRAHEQDLSKRHERELGELSAAHHRETHVLLSDFNKAQELLRDKITALQILLEGTEDKFRNRESRQEDLRVITELRDMVSEREALVKKLVDDKKFYQLELVSRETGFNKVFNTSPNIGVINPLIKLKRSGSGHLYVSWPDLNVDEEEGEGEGKEGEGLAPPSPPLQSALAPRSSKAPPPSSSLPPTPQPDLLTPQSPPEREEEEPAEQGEELYAQYFTF